MGKTLKRALVLFSGGVDSTTLLYRSLPRYKEVEAISFNYGSKHNGKELQCASNICALLKIKHTIISLQLPFKSSLLVGGEALPHGHYSSENMKNTVVPFRNGILLSIAAGYADSEGIEHLLIGAHAGDHPIYPDCRPYFLNKMKEAIQTGTSNTVHLKFPFQHMTKIKIVSIGLKLGVPYEMTWSCYEGQDGPCLKCGTCVERLEAFTKNNMKDPL